MTSFKNLTNQKFGRLLAICPTKKRKHRFVVWLCRCDCGNLVEAKSGQLASGGTKSCGCLQKERTKQVHTTHGDAAKKTRLYRTRTNMKQRCYDRNNIAYHRYGGRGIEICDKWNNSYPAFKAWALANGYADNLTIDRIDNDGNYEPSNCQWLTRSENYNKFVVERRERKNDSI